MRCAFSLALAALACSIRLAAIGHPPTASFPQSRPTPGVDQTSRPTSAEHPLLILKMPRFTETAVRRAVALALGKLADPGCSAIYDDFALPDGQALRRRLDRMAIGPGDFLESLVFLDGSRDAVCANGGVGLATTPGSRLIRVCPSFAEFQLRKPGMSGVLIIHESLHALGLGENPPTSSEITQRVERRCWKAPKAIQKVRSPQS